MYIKLYLVLVYSAFVVDSCDRFYCSNNGDCYQSALNSVIKTCMYVIKNTNYQLK